jgi:hypothetical protein
MASERGTGFNIFVTLDAAARTSDLRALSFPLIRLAGPDTLKAAMTRPPAPNIGAATQVTPPTFSS